MFTWSLEQPALLLIALLAVPVVLVGRVTLRSLDAFRRWVIIGTRIALILVLALLLAGLSKAMRHDHLTVIGVVDVSGSIRTFARTPDVWRAAAANFPGVDIDDPVDVARTWIRESVVEHRRPDDRIGLVTFEGKPRAVTVPTVRDDYRDDVAEVELGEGTNIAEALRFALAMFPPDTAKRIVLFSDGNATSDDALEAAREAAGVGGRENRNARPASEVDDAGDRAATGNDATPTASASGIPIDVVPIAYRVDREVVIERLEVPAFGRPGQRVTVRALLRATEAASGRLTLLHEGRPVDLNGPGEPGVSRRVTLQPGLNVETATVELESAAINRFRLLFEPDERTDTLVSNNEAEAFTSTPQRGSVLVVDGVWGDLSTPLPAVLREAGLQVTVVGPEAFPENPVELQAYDLVILQNVPARQIAQPQQLLLARYVEDLGGGLIMVGGYDSFGAGGWIDTPVAAVMPVLLDLPDELRVPTAAIAIVLDRSQSMAAPVLGSSQTQQEIANEGAALAIQSLDPLDYITLVAFNSSPSVVIPVQRVGQTGPLIEKAVGITPEGGTNLFPAMEAAFRALEPVEADIKHVVCLSDGQSVGSGFEALAAEMNAAGITVSTIAVGDGADVQTMQAIAEQGGGQSYIVLNPQVLPRIFVKDVALVRRPMIRESPFVPDVLPTGSALTDGLSDIPPLGGYVMTRPRPDPTVNLLMETPEAEPLLAWWQAGLGRVAAFTSDAHDNWATEWLGWSGYRQLWVQLARTISRPAGTNEFQLRTRVEGDELVVSLEALDDIGGGGDGEDPPADGTEPAAADRLRFDTLTVPATVYAPSGESIPVTLRQVGPTTYTARVPAPHAGNYVVAATPRQGRRHLGLVVGGVSRASGVEYRRLQSNISHLREIAALTGGRVLSLEDVRGANLFDRRGLPPTVSVIPVWPYLLAIAIALFLFDVAVRRIAWTRDGVLARLRLVTRSTASEARARQEQVRGTLSGLRGARDRVGDRYQPADGVEVERPQPIRQRVRPKPAQATPSAASRAPAQTQGEQPAAPAEHRAAAPTSTHGEPKPAGPVLSPEEQAARRREALTALRGRKMKRSSEQAAEEPTTAAMSSSEGGGGNGRPSQADPGTATTAGRTGRRRPTSAAPGATPDQANTTSSPATSGGIPDNEKNDGGSLGSTLLARRRKKQSTDDDAVEG